MRDIERKARDQATPVIFIGPCDGIEITDCEITTCNGMSLTVSGTLSIGGISDAGGLYIGPMPTWQSLLMVALFDRYRASKRALFAAFHWGRW